MENAPTRGPTTELKTILLVDDDVSVLKFVGGFLSQDGYCVLTAADARSALALASDHAGIIDLLLSDFEMPIMNGIELATALVLVRPQIKVLMMSGFTGGMLVLNEGWHFLAKPFVSSQLRSLIAGLLFPDKSRFRDLD
jgi:two-component system cell cycle sensor histidine kinase/response regulator CckA